MTGSSLDDTVRSLLETAREDLALSDQKASILIAAVGIGVSVALTSLLAGDVEFATLTQAQQAVWVFGGVFAVASVVCAAAAVWPSLTRGGRARGRISHWRQLGGVANPKSLRDRLEHAPDTDEAAERELIAISRSLRFRYIAMQASIVFAGASGLALAVAAFRFL